MTRDDLSPSQYKEVVGKISQYKAREFMLRIEYTRKLDELFEEFGYAMLELGLQTKRKIK